MYRIYDTLDEIVTMIEQARGLPMSTSAMVPRDHILDLLDELRERLPDEVTQAKAVLDQRGDLLHAARVESDRIAVRAGEEAQALTARVRAEAEQVRALAQQRQEELIAAGQREYDRLVNEGSRTRLDLIAAAQQEHDELIAQGRSERERLISESDVYRSAVARADELGAATAAAAEAMRREVDSYVDAKLGEFEATLSHLLRSVEHGRANVGSRGQGGSARE
ncbi:MAG: hypothetical protein H0T54_07365 [Geodermatophilaceae bacterium]|nr:hypothetical protein [Geodermatophilaceae bacterium]